MKQDSLFKALDIIIKALENSNIDKVDKVELMLNLRWFLLNYDKQIKRTL